MPFLKKKCSGHSALTFSRSRFSLALCSLPSLYSPLLRAPLRSTLAHSRSLLSPLVLFPRSLTHLARPVPVLAASSSSSVLSTGFVHWFCPLVWSLVLLLECAPGSYLMIADAYIRYHALHLHRFYQPEFPFIHFIRQSVPGPPFGRPPEPAGAVRSSPSTPPVSPFLIPFLHSHSGFSHHSDALPELSCRHPPNLSLSPVTFLSTPVFPLPLHHIPSQGRARTRSPLPNILSFPSQRITTSPQLP